MKRALALAIIFIGTALVGVGSASRSADAATAYFPSIDSTTPTLTASAVFTVNSTLDAVDANPGDGSCATSGGLCTLRAAIMEANHTTGGGATIIIPGSTSVYEVAIPHGGLDDETIGDLNINANMTLVGKPSILRPYIIIDASLASDRVFSIEGANVTMSNISAIRNGQAALGGGIINNGALTLINCTVISNTANSASGGGIYNYNGATLTLSNSLVISNSVTNDLSGGGIFNIGLITLTNSIVSGNSGFTGGGIFNAGTATLTNSTVSDNKAALGGGIYNDTADSLMLNNTMIVSNTADSPQGGGGIVNLGILVTNNSIIVSNTAAVGSVQGGGISNFGSATLNNSTISANVAELPGRRRLQPRDFDADK